MVTEGAVRQELLDNYPGLDKDRFFEDYVRIGHSLSKGPGEPKFIEALKSLEKSLVLQVESYFKYSLHQTISAEEASANAVEHFLEKQRRQWSTKPLPKKEAFKNLLASALSTFEVEHGFRQPSAKVPLYVNIVAEDTFLSALKSKEHWKDVGALYSHGEFTHRLQWYVIIHAGIIREAPPRQEAEVFAAIGNYKRARDGALWNLLCDRMGTIIPGDFRRPETFSGWLRSESAETICPVLRQMLITRSDKRRGMTLDSMDENYVRRKIGWKLEDIKEARASVYRWSDDKSAYRPVPGSKGR